MLSSSVLSNLSASTSRLFSLSAKSGRFDETIPVSIYVFLQTCSPLSHAGEGCVWQRNNLSKSKCNFRWVVMLRQSELLNYFSVTVMIALWSWCVQIMASFHFACLMCFHQNKILDGAVIPTQEMVQMCLIQLIQNTGPYICSQTCITTSVYHNLPLCSLQHCTVKESAVNYLLCLCCAWWDGATPDE